MLIFLILRERERETPRTDQATMLIFLILFFFLQLSSAQNECTPTRCSDLGPSIRFPFRIKDRQPLHCAYPGFDLSCSSTNTTILHLPLSVKFQITAIDYASQSIHIKDPDNCFPKNLRNLTLSSTLFHFSDYVSDFSFFTCPSKDPDPHRSYYLIDCLSHGNSFVYAAFADNWLYYQPMLSCTKMYNITAVPTQAFNRTNEMQLKWPQRICGICEAQGKYCRLMNNSTDAGVECFGDLNPMHKKGEAKRRAVIAGVTVGTFLLAVAVLAIFWVFRLRKIKKEDQLKIERFLEDYRALKPARYSYADIKKITEQLKDKVGQGSYGTVFRGQLSNDVHVAVKILNNSKGNGEEFINEVGIIGRIHHVNVVRLVGYCADGFRRALIYEFLPNDSLEKFVSSDYQRGLLGWKKLQEIAMGIAKGIEYLHQGCEQRILHFDIKPHNILLDHNLNPKVSDFGLAKLCSKEQSAVSMTTARGTVGYIAPEVFSRNFGNVSYKSDIYSFGIMLLEMVGGKKNSDANTNNTNQVYFPEWIYNRLDSGEELGINIQDEGDAKIVRKLAIVGLWCIQWYPVDRPAMNVVIQMLEGDGDTLTMPPNPFASTNPTGVLGGRPFNRELEVIVESD